MLPQILAIAGLFLSILLVYFNIRKKPQTIYIGLFFAFLSAYTYFHYVMIYSQSKELVAIVFLHSTFVGYLIGPMLFFYTRSIVHNQNRIKLFDLIHFLPALYFIIASIPYYMLSWPTKLEIAAKIIHDPNQFWQTSRYYLTWLIPLRTNYPSRPILLLVYTAISIFLLIKHKRPELKPSSKVDSNHNYQWLFILLAVVFIFSFIHSTMMIYSVYKKDSFLFFTNNIFQVGSGVTLLIIMIIPFLYPSVLYGINPVLLNIQDTNYEDFQRIKNNAEELAEEELPQPKKTPEFDAAYLESLKILVEKHMAEEKCYLQKDCNLNIFARTINIPTHHLTHYFKEVRGQSFNDFKNEFRINHAKVLLIEPNNKLFTMEAIGTLSGFTSKNAFYIAFNKFEGCSPGAYIEKNQIP